jgi:hypothetical protein
MRSLFAFGALVTLVGCTVGNPDLPDAEAQTSSTATAIIVVERSPSGDAIIARFVRAKQGPVDDVALRTAGVQALPALDTCVTTPLEGPAAGRAIDLLDVGNMTFETTPLAPRAVPDPAGIVGGYIYAARSTDSFAASSRVALKASGGIDLPEGFAVSLAAPHELDKLQVAPAPTGLDVTWDDGDARDLVYVDVQAPSFVARCSGSDVGHLTIPATVLGTVEEGTLSVHRVHREAFKTRGIDPGEVRFDLARVVAFHR